MRAYLVAFGYFAGCFVVIGASLWTYLNGLTFLGVPTPVQWACLILILCAVLAVSTVRGWGRT